VLLLSKVDWWFAYTAVTRDYLMSKKITRDQITIVNNAVEDKLSVHLQHHDTTARTDARNGLGLSGNNIALFCGGLYKQKRIEFLLQAAKLIRTKIPDFELLIVGEGPDRPLVEQAAASNSWIHYAGAIHGPAIAQYWHAAKVLLMPGLVGLVIVDGFIARCPIVTTRYPYHSPEIAYLEHGFNGVVTADNIESFSAAAIQLLEDNDALDILRLGCAQSADNYTLDKMVENFAQGIESCLKCTNKVHAFK
jgi:glycosyltransferase involved in cell wall biosynthesis